MPNRHGKVVNYCEGLPLIMSHEPLPASSRDVPWQIKKIFTITMAMATKPFRVVIYRKELPPLDLHDPSIRWSCEVKRQFDQVTSLRSHNNLKNLNLHFDKPYGH